MTELLFKKITACLKFYGNIFRILTEKQNFTVFFWIASIFLVKYKHIPQNVECKILKTYHYPFAWRFVKNRLLFFFFKKKNFRPQTGVLRVPGRPPLLGWLQTPAAGPGQRPCPPPARPSQWSGPGTWPWRPLRFGGPTSWPRGPGSRAVQK